MSTSLSTLTKWVDEVANRTQPDQIVWCCGSDEEYEQLVQEMQETGTLSELNPKTYPNCYLHLSDPSDVARVEHLTFVCTQQRDDAGPNNNWLSPADGHAKIDELFKGAMRGRTMYVIPYCMGPIDSPYSRCGVEITDSAYVVVNMKLMTRMGTAALERIERDGTFVKGLHSTGDLDPSDDSSCIFRRSYRSRVSARDMAATHCSARSAMRCESPATRRAPRAGSLSTC